MFSTQSPEATTQLQIIRAYNPRSLYHLFVACSITKLFILFFIPISTYFLSLTHNLKSNSSTVHPGFWDRVFHWDKELNPGICLCFPKPGIISASHHTFMCVLGSNPKVLWFVWEKHFTCWALPPVQELYFTCVSPNATLISPSPFQIPLPARMVFWECRCGPRKIEGEKCLLSGLLLPIDSVYSVRRSLHLMDVEIF